MNFWRETEKLCFLLVTVILPEAHLSVCKLLHQFYSSQMSEEFLEKLGLELNFVST